MFRVSNFVVGIVNAVTMAVGLTSIGFAVYFFLHAATNCERALQNPLIITGIALTAVSLLGIIGSCCKNNVVLVTYLTILFLTIVSLILFSVFVFFVTNEGAGKVVSGRGYREYKTADFSSWLRNHFVDRKRWEEIRTCLVDAGVCRNLDDGRVGLPIESSFYKKNLSPIQSGCCKPPSECNFEFKNATWWERPKNSVQANATKNSDCAAWSNVQRELCFGCNSCKAGVLANIRQKWRHLLIFNACLTFLVITLYSFGCCARTNNRKDKKKSTTTA